MKHKFGILGLVIIVTAAAIGGIVGSSARRRPSANTAAVHRNIDITDIEDSYSDAVNTVDANYAGEIDYEKASQAAIQGMLSTLDPHSVFFSRAEFRRLQQDQDSRFYGIGVSILQHHDGVYVQNVVDGTPAFRAGLQYGDRILEVDGEDARSWTGDQVSKKVRGEINEPVRLKIERAGRQTPILITIVRASVPLPSIRDSFIVKPGTGYVGLIGGFQHTTDDELREALSTLREQGMRQLVLDLRNNPGGLLEQAIDVGSAFLDRGKVIVSVKGRNEYSEPSVYQSKGSDNGEFPLVVLINRNSASASEIVAGAIQDHGRGLLVGETSFGKGLVQRVYPLLFGTGLTLTTAHYYTPYGRLIQRDYSTGSFYDYYVRHDEEDTFEATNNNSAGKPSSSPSPSASPTPHPPSGPAVRTAAGRVFYGGGGITPDIEVRAVTVTRLRQRIAEAAFYFTRQLAAGLVPGMENFKVDRVDFKHVLRPTDFAVTDRWVDAFRSFLARSPELNLTAPQLDSELEAVKLRLRYEMATAAFGGDAGQRVLTENDPQVLRAIEVLPDARKLAELAKQSDPMG